MWYIINECPIYCYLQYKTLAINLLKGAKVSTIAGIYETRMVPQHAAVVLLRLIMVCCFVLLVVLKGIAVVYVTSGGGGEEEEEERGLLFARKIGFQLSEKS